MPRPSRPCPHPGCPELIDPATGDCAQQHRAQQRKASRARADRDRPTAWRRGYDRGHRTRFRAAVLKRDPICVLCRRLPARHADHWPLTRKQLIARGLDPNDPRYGRGLCASCHSRETARNDGAFGNTPRPIADRIHHTEWPGVG